MTQAAPTWIDERIAEAWRCGERARHYTGAARWIVYLDESCTAFVVLATNSDQSWIGGDDTPYPAFEVAAAIERWSADSAGLNDCPEFIDALQRDMRHAEAKGTRLDIIRAQYLLNAMQARTAIAHAEDAPPFTGFARPWPDHEAKTSTLVIPWEAGHDS